MMRCLWDRRVGYHRAVFALFVCALSVGLALAGPVSSQHAGGVVRGWLRVKGRSATTAGGRHRRLGPVQGYGEDQGEHLYHVVNLEPQGFVVVAGEDIAEPIIAFSTDGQFDPSPTRPLAAMLARDLPGRLAAARRRQQSTDADPRSRKVRVRIRRRWEQLQAAGELPEPPANSIGDVDDLDDVRVEPLVASAWGQTTVGDYSGGISLYNYYTGPDADGSANNYPCGCVATSMAQLMRYHQHPAGSPWNFNYGQMPLVPNSSITLAQRQAIGRLCYEAAESVETEYGQLASSASLYDSARELVQTFDYGQSIHGYNGSDNIEAERLNRMVSPNLDAGLVVLLGLDGSGGGHAVACDGYGYDGGTLYHHLNMGWSGRANVWYALPDVDTAYYDFSVVNVCVYNIFPSGTGQVLSGRIVDPFGEPLPGVSVNLIYGSHTLRPLTNDRGIYAQIGLPPNTTITVTPTKRDWIFTSQSVKTGWTMPDTQRCGNVWGVDFVGYPEEGLVQFDRDSYVAGQTITIQLVDAALAGRGEYDVTVETQAGDHELVRLVESGTDSGAFEGTIATAQAHWTVDDGVLQVWHGQTLTTSYPDGAATDNATIEGVAETVYTDTFDEGLGAEWEIVDGQDDGYTWFLSDPTQDFGEGAIMLVDSDLPQQPDMDESLVLYLDASNWVQLRLHFEHYFKYYHELPEEVGDVDVRIGQGDWQNLARYQGQIHSGEVTLDLPSAADGHDDVQIRWRYYNANYDYHWAIDNVTIEAIVLPQPPVAYGQVVYAPTGQSTQIALEAEDDGYPRGVLNYVIASVPRHGLLRDTTGRAIHPSDLPYTLPEGGNGVAYTPAACYVGLDEFTFTADDDGEAPDGGQGTPAAISLLAGAVMHTQFEQGVPDGWEVIDGYDDTMTWEWLDAGAYAMMIVDSDYAGRIWMDEELISAPID